MCMVSFVLRGLALRPTYLPCVFPVKPFTHAVIALFSDEERSKLMTIAKTIVPTTRETTIPAREAPSKSDRKAQLVSIGKLLKDKCMLIATPSDPQ